MQNVRGSCSRRPVEFKISAASPVLVLIQSTDATITGFIRKGLWQRQRMTLEAFAERFSVLYYTSDGRNYQDQMPAGVRHIGRGCRGDLFGLRHASYYFGLLISAFEWRLHRHCIIRVFGVTIPVLPALKAIAGKKVVVSFQYDWASEMRSVYGGIKKVVAGAVQHLSIGSADHVICTMDWLKCIATTKYRREQVTVIPNYVDTAMFCPSSNKVNHVVYVGRLHWSKGVDTLIESFAMLRRGSPDYELIIVGDGEERAKLERSVSTGSQVTFHGSVPFAEVARTLNDSRIFVLPTKTREGHPKALVEAMASGCVCIASRVPGNADVLRECDCNDLLFEAGDSLSLLSRLQYAVSSAQDSRQLRFAREKYAKSVVMHREIAILESMLS